MAELLFVYLFEGSSPDVSHIAMGGAVITMCDRHTDRPGWQRQRAPFVLTRALFAKLTEDIEHFCPLCVRRAGQLVDLP